MSFREYFFRNMTVLNAVLLAVVFAAGVVVFHTVQKGNARYVPPAGAKPAPEKEAGPEPQKPALSPSDYTIIGEQNLFHPLRLIPVEKPPAPPLPVPEFVLYGTLFTGDMSVAYLEDKKAPQTTAGRGKRQTALRRGEAMSGFVLIEVDADKVVLARGEEKITVTLQAPKVRETPAAAQNPPAGQPSAAAPQPSQAPGAASAQSGGAAPGQQPSSAVAGG